MDGTSSEYVTVFVRYRGEQLELVLPRLAAVRDLMHALQARTLIAPERQRLLGCGRPWRADDSLASLVGSSQSARVLLVGSTESEIEAARETAALAAARSDSAAAVPPADLRPTTRPLDHSASIYGIGSVRELPGLPQQEEARAILEELASDPGVLAVLRKHRWKVGVLSELYPEGKVGVSDVCLMGLNRNKGQEICLRLRTDDLQGFRKIQSVREVLWHELAHMEISEHNAAFWTLCSQIGREVRELDWRQQAGRRLGGAAGVRRLPHVAVAASETMVGDAEGGAPAGMAGSAGDGGCAVVRQRTAEEGVDASSGQSNMRVDTDSDPACVPAAAAALVAAEAATATISTTSAYAAPAAPAAPTNTPFATLVGGAVALPSTAAATPIVDAPPTVASAAPNPMEFVGLDDALAERIRRIVAALARIRSTAPSPGSAVRTLRVLGACLRNVLQHPAEPKFRQLRRSTRTFQSAIEPAPGALQLLEAAGWIVDDNAMVRLAREDAALLWLAADMVDKEASALRAD